MKNVLIVDCETTGLDPTKDQVIEVGAIVYSVEHARAADCFSALIHAQENPAEAVNRIPAGLLDQHGWPASQAWEWVRSMAADADAVLAHNAEFDRSFTPPDVTGQLPWICTKSDLQWPKQTRPESSLVSLALEHDLGVAVAHLLTRCHELGHDLGALLARGLRPKVTLMACVSYEDREKAKAQGFHWNAPRKQWLRRMVEEDAAFDFPVRVVEDEVRS